MTQHIAHFERVLFLPAQIIHFPRLPGGGASCATPGRLWPCYGPQESRGAMFGLLSRAWDIASPTACPGPSCVLCSCWGYGLRQSHLSTIRGEITMPMTVTTGLSKKVGTANYGSVGAMCNITFEADHNLLDHDLEGFQQRVKNAFVAARQAVQDQLTRELNAPAGSADSAPPPVAAIATGANGNGNGASGTNANGANDNHGNSNGANGNADPTNGNGHRNGNSGHGASEKQLGYVRQLARSIQGLGVRKLETLAGTMFGKPLAALTTMDASGLIDCLKSIKDGKIDLDSVLEGNAA